jgi:hypothetical protein
LSRLAFNSLHWHCHCLVVQIDIEGSEWTSLPPLLDSIASGDLRVGQLMVELHAVFLPSKEWDVATALVSHSTVSLLTLFFDGCSVSCGERIGPS